jgi:hypothetical protein
MREEIMMIKKVKIVVYIFAFLFAAQAGIVGKSVIAHADYYNKFNFTTDENGYEYYDDDGEIYYRSKGFIITEEGQLVDYNGTGTQVTIPSEICGIKVTVLKGGFDNNKKIKKVTIPDSVSYLEDGIFSGCTNLKSVKLGGKITEISEGAFKNCTSLTSITIPNGVTEISDKAFYNCKKLKTIKLNKKLNNISNAAFYNCVSLTKIELPANVDGVGEKAFYNCKKLKSVTLGKNTIYIGAAAFQNCSSLTQITLPSKLWSVDEKAFYNCKNLKSVTIQCKNLMAATEDSVPSLGNKAFAGIHANATIKVPKGKLTLYKQLLKAGGVTGKSQKITE